MLCDGVLTLKHKLFHLDLIELVGADDDAVAGQMNAAAGLQSFNLLRYEEWRCESIDKEQTLLMAAFYNTLFSFSLSKYVVISTLRMQYLLRLSL